MYKRIKGIMVLALVLTFIPLSTTALYAEDSTVESETIIEVSTPEQFLEAVQVEGANIELKNDIVVPTKVNITANNVTIDGKHHTISTPTRTEWDGTYVLQFYLVDATVKDIKLTGGNAGLLVNGSNVTLVGNIDVSGNTHGGIEVSQGQGVTRASNLYIGGAILVNETETETTPTIWLDKITEGVHMNANQLIETVVADKNQVFYHLPEEPGVAEVSSEQQLLDAIEAEEPVIKLGDDITLTQSIAILHDVTIDGNHKTITAQAGAEWTGLYVFQFYQVEATVKDITLTGGDAGMLVNGSYVTLEGTVDVSGNNFGGIEVSQGVDVTEDSILNIVDANLVNTTEEFGKPTIWIDKYEGSVLSYMDQVRRVYPLMKNQEFLFINGLTEKEETAIGMLLNAFSVEARNGFTAKTDKDRMFIELTKKGTEFTEDDIVDYFTNVITADNRTRHYTLMSNESSAAVSGPITTKEQVREDVLTFFRNMTDPANMRANTERTTDMEALLNMHASLELHYELDGDVVPSDIVTVQIGFENTNTPVDPKPEVPTEKEEAKTPNTGINASYSLFLMTGIAGAALLVILKKKKYN